MKKLLIASTALSLAGGAAFAEMAITVSGDAEMGVDYASEPAGGASKHSFVHEVGIDFTASGTTDGGLTFGGSAGFDTKDTDLNTGTVNVSGSFGTLTIGDNDSADLTAGGIADIGMNGIGVDDMVEGLRGTTAGQLRYDNSFGQVSIAISAGTTEAKAAVPASQWMITDHEGTTHVYPWNYEKDMDGMVTLKGAPGIGGRSVVPSQVQTALEGDNVLAFGRRYDGLFGVVDRTATAVWVDYDGDGYGISNIPGFYGTVPDDLSGYTAEGKTVPVNIFGYGRNKDGKITRPPTAAEITASESTAAVLTQASRVLATEKDNADEIDAFMRYEKHYDLGGDKEVGGANDPDSDKAEDQKADSFNATTLTNNAAPAVASDSEYAFGMSFNAGGVTIGVGYDSKKTVSMGAGFTTGEITTNLLYVKTDEDFSNADGTIKGEMTGMGVDMAYAMGASTVTLSYGRRKPETGEAMDAVGMGVTHDLGGGATMNAGFGKVDKKVGTKIVSENKASVGLMFAF